MNRIPPPRPPAFMRDERGGTAVEFGLLCFLFITVMLGIIDLSRLVWEVNSAKAATRAGARYAVVNAPIASIFDNYDGVAAAGGNGLPVPESAALDITCTSSGCSSGGRNATVFDALVTRMQGYYGRVAAANVVVEYRHVGIGVAGNPCAPDAEPLVTVRLTGLTFSSTALQIVGVGPFTLPPVATSLSGESLGQLACA